MHAPHTLSVDQLPAFLKERPYTIIHFDADWDENRHAVRERMESLATAGNEDISFGYIDIDRNQEHAKAIGLLNVPACCYYRGEELIGTVIGMNQDIATNLAAIRNGGHPNEPNRC
jgi:thiol-disulfide isomerase/thioredoxin